MPKTLECATERAGSIAQLLHVDAHEIRADLPVPEGGNDTAPGPHELFDAALAACKTLTAHWYAKRNNMALERVECRIERDDSAERSGRYLLKVHLAYHGNLSDAERARLHAAVGKCPIHKLMTTTEVVIETAPLADATA
jgi:putative redox protein